MEAGGSAVVRTDGGIAQRQRLRQKQRQKKRLDGSGPILKPFPGSTDPQVNLPASFTCRNPLSITFPLSEFRLLGLNY